MKLFVVFCFSLGNCLVLNIVFYNNSLLPNYFFVYVNFLRCALNLDLWAVFDSRCCCGASRLPARTPARVNEEILKIASFVYAPPDSRYPVISRNSTRNAANTSAVRIRFLYCRAALQARLPQIRRGRLYGLRKNRIDKDGRNGINKINPICVAGSGVLRC